MTDAPKRIWADPPETFDGMDIWRSEPGGKGVEYILASEHAALIREAEARGMERAAARARVYASNHELASDGRNTLIMLAEWADGEAAAIRSEATK